MKIAIIAHSLYPISEPFSGGLEMITHLLTRKLSALGHEIDLYAHEDSEGNFNLKPFKSIETFRKETTEEEASHLGFSYDEMYQTHIYNEAMQQVMCGNYDLIHNHSMHSIPIIQGEFFGEKFMTTFHTPAFAHLQFGLKSIPKPAKQKFTVISKKQGKLWGEFVDKFEVVYNGVEVKDWVANVEETAEHFFWMGRICPEKAPHLAIEACLKADKKLILAGPKSNKPYFEESVKPYLANPNIEYLGHLKQHEISEVLRNCKAMLFTSLWDEPYGLTIAESLACGTPVVSFDVRASPEILCEKSGILVKLGSSDSLATALGEIGKISRRDCRERAETFCSSEAMVKNYENLYYSMINPKSLVYV